MRLCFLRARFAEFLLHELFQELGSLPRLWIFLSLHMTSFGP